MSCKVERYRELILAISEHLAQYGDQRWAPRLEGWLTELDDSETENKQYLVDHVERMQKALGGMGSIGDIVICPEAGYSIQNEEGLIQKANDDLLRLVRLLDKCISSILNKYK